MIRALLERFRQKHRTVAYPARPPTIPERYRGAPELAPDKCTAGCAACKRCGIYDAEMMT